MDRVESRSSKALETLDSFIDLMGDWAEPMKGQIASPGFKMLYKFVKREYESTTCYPPAE